MQNNIIPFPKRVEFIDFPEDTTFFAREYDMYLVVNSCNSFVEKAVNNGIRIPLRTESIESLLEYLKNALNHKLKVKGVNIHE